MKQQEFKVVSKSVEKIDAMSLALGKPSYVADLQPAGTLYVGMLWSPHAHARIKSVDIAAAENMPGVAGVLFHGNVPRVPHTTAGQGFPEPSPYDTVMFDSKVRFVGDRVAAVAAETPKIAAAAAKAIQVEYEVLEPVLSIDDALADGSPVIHDQEDASIPIPVPYEPARNIAARVGMDVGDLEQGLAEADIKLDRTYETHYAQHTPMETHVSLAQVDSRGRLVITTSTQVPFHVRRIVAQTLQIPVQQIRVIKPRIGGGFGAKQEILLEDVAALFALRTGRPVLFEMTRSEEFISSRTRHPQRVRIRSGVTADGRITALGMDVVSNTGAYGSHALTVVCNCGSKVLPLYRTTNIHFEGVTVYTNLPVAGAYRGYGATQACFAVECHMDEVAEAIGMDPLKFRQMNHIRSGEGSPVFAALGEGKEGVEQAIGSCELEECIRLGAEEIGWGGRGMPGEKTGRFRRGIGMACLMQGSSIPRVDMGAASLKMNEDGSFNLLVGATDLGTGSDTVLAQIAAEQLGTDVGKMVVYSSDTDMTPFDVGAYASSTTYLSGEAVRKVAEKVKKQIVAVAANKLGVPAERLVVEASSVATADGSQSVTFSDVAIHALYQMDQFQVGGIASHTTEKSPPPFSAHFAEVEVDTLTGGVRVIKYVAAVDCGTAINPKLAEGQTEGGVLNGISYALTEQYLFDSKGRMSNASFHNYHIFSMRDMPELKTILVPSYEETGPYGAKSVSEICINGPMPAIANAIYNAAGVRLTHPPFTPDKVWQALQ
ncbi:MAG: molybdopterin-dependent oxidoreductase [Kiritimatiellia bacterium]|jgi:probable selenate reductase molybdenum-binding subunit|nr:molybdopterin-dependent oxidoreductase [Kiritimatiellia bacterium]MDP6631761.1 molybdopterin-dependent oxidoreductase [Kiritimatiellia bacterium]MDP6810485.1 molybdopterin-dependent oxidoreductase [Kiritimatiellia bacterium]MDP7024997.1 molybdopterin-dependent oxidoreductase [Kiritimatiellia bacterium]